MDDLDKKIIMILEENSRTTISDIAKEINLSRCSVKERIVKLSNNKVIEKFCIKTNIKHKGYNVIFIVLIKEIYESKTNILDYFKNNPFVIKVYHTAGISNYILKVATPDINTMHTFIYDLQKLAKIETSIILENIIEKELELRVE